MSRNTTEPTRRTRNLWRFDRQRLDADAIREFDPRGERRLNLKAGGPGFFPSVTREALEGLSRKGAEWTPPRWKIRTAGRSTVLKAGDAAAHADGVRLRRHDSPA